MKQLLLAYYGDDFTGSTDALEFLCRAGAKTMLFIEPPTTEQLQSFPDLDAYGVAGKTRSLSPTEIETVLVLAFNQMKATSPKHIHYKVCSTFDSSSKIGSIGKVIDIASPIFNNQTLPIIGGAPHLGRYCLFGNLFARMGIGSNGQIHRLDRHPSMSKHPVTPMDESDLRLHLQKQTNQAIGLIDVLQQEQTIESWIINKQENVSLLDALYEDQLLKIGEWMESLQKNNQTLFSIGGSSVEVALGKHSNQQGTITPVTNWKPIEKAKPLLVVSGSCSPVTAAQIAYAIANDFEEVVIDAIALANDGKANEQLLSQVTQLLQQQKNVIVHTGNKEANNLPSEKLGTALGLIAKHAVKQTGIKRVVVAGGDTSSYAARAMEIEAVEMIAPLVIGAPLCKAHSKNKSINGLEVNFKGGQVGSENYFGLF
jgi:uncharacterized protein YgbK (DUF1537 family)